MPSILAVELPLRARRCPWLVGAVGAVAEVVVELVPGEPPRSVPAPDHAAPEVRLVLRRDAEGVERRPGGGCGGGDPEEEEEEDRVEPHGRAARRQGVVGDGVGVRVSLPSSSASQGNGKASVS